MTLSPPDHDPTSSPSSSSSNPSPSRLEILGFYDTLSVNIYLRAPPGEGTDNTLNLVEFVQTRDGCDAYGYGGRSRADILRLINLHRP